MRFKTDRGLDIEIKNNNMQLSPNSIHLLIFLKRLSVVETDLGHNDLDIEEEHKPTIQEQIKELSNRIEQPLCRPTICIKMDTEIYFSDGNRT